MKFYFGIIIAVLVVVILLLFVILYKIYKLHLKSTEEVIDIFEHQELLSSFSSSKGSSEISNAYEVKEYSDNTSDSHSVDLLDGVQGRQEVEVAQVQPDVKELLSSNSSSSLENIKLILPQKEPLKNQSNMKLMLQYDKKRSLLKVVLRHIDGKFKCKPGASEAYVDIQVSAYQFRTFRNPGYRRPTRAILKKQIDFHLDISELKTSFLLVFLLRYDPFSRLKIDGEVVVKLVDVLNEGFMDGCQIDVSKEIMKSRQDFTAFIFRPF